MIHSNLNNIHFFLRDDFDQRIVTELASFLTREVNDQPQSNWFRITGIGRKIGKTSVQPPFPAAAEGTKPSFTNQNEAAKKPGILEGRKVPGLVYTHNGSALVIKRYFRGGVIRRFIKNRYIHVGTLRPKNEFEFMRLAGKAGASVPEPMGYAVMGKFFYMAWLIIEEIPDHKNFARLCFSKESKAMELMPLICNNIECLVKNRIFHVDLHPGNILVDGNEQPYIIDFDKARIFRGSGKRLAEKYRKRWQRAVRKHGLPDSLSRLGI